MNKQYWLPVWKHGVFLANNGKQKSGEDYSFIASKVAPLGETDINDKDWVKSVREALLSSVPSLAFEYWRQEGWLAHALPEIDKLWGMTQPAEYHPEIDTGIHAMMVIDRAAADSCSENTRWAALAHDFGKSLTPIEMLPSHYGHEQAGVPLVLKRYTGWNVPDEVLEISLIVTENHGRVHLLESMNSNKVYKMIKDCGLDKSEARLEDFCNAVACDDRGRKGMFHIEARGANLLKECVHHMIKQRENNFQKYEDFWKMKCEKFLIHKNEDISQDMEMKERLREIQYISFDQKSISDKVAEYKQNKNHEPEEKLNIKPEPQKKIKKMKFRS